MEAQLKLEAEGGITFPQVVVHKKKDGRLSEIEYNLSKITDEKIQEAVNTGKNRAKEVIEELGMKEVLEKGGRYKNPLLKNKSFSDKKKGRKRKNMNSL